MNKNALQKKKKYKIRLLMCICGSILVIGWFFRYQTLNAYFAETFSCPRLDYKIGEVVDFGNNTIASNSAPGYDITILNSEIIPYADYINTLKVDESITIDNAPEYVMDITARLHNTNSTASGIYLPDFLLHSYDMYTDPNFELISLANPVLEAGSYGISLKEGTEYTVHIIYNLRREHLSSYVYNNLDQYPFFLRLTTYPIRQEVKLQ